MKNLMFAFAALLISSTAFADLFTNPTFKIELRDQQADKVLISFVTLEDYADRRCLSSEVIAIKPATNDHLGRIEISAQLSLERCSPIVDSGSDYGDIWIERTALPTGRYDVWINGQSRDTVEIF